jgi:PKHD-type hydroxylase
LIVQIDVLSQEELHAVRKELTTASFQDGAVTAGPVARRVKNNEQARGEDPDVIALARRIRIGLQNHPLVHTTIRPVHWSRLMFSRYGPGRQYGLHADDAMMTDADGWPLRTDISFTLFLSDPGAYEGGALSIRDTGGDRHFRPEAGAAIFYSTGQLHSVTPVTRGVRLACVGWVQSLIRGSDRLQLLADLEQIRSDPGHGESSLLLDKTIGNLIRMWSEP